MVILTRKTTSSGRGGSWLALPEGNRNIESNNRILQFFLDILYVGS